jgi:hypothetical protein
VKPFADVMIEPQFVSVSIGESKRGGILRHRGWRIVHRGEPQDIVGFTHARHPAVSFRDRRYC